jgi:K+-transporting ATPase KdpF subunit
MCQVDVNTRPSGVHQALTVGVTEDLVAAVIAIALIAYLVYALARPDRF